VLTSVIYWVSSHRIPAQKFGRVNGVKSQPITVGVGLRQGCVLSPLLFVVHTNWKAVTAESTMV